MSEIITEKWLRDRDACEDGIQFAIRNKLIGATVDQIREVEGDFLGFVKWIEYTSKCNIEYDDHGNAIKRVHPLGYVWICEYDENDNMIKQAFSNGDEWTYEYDRKNNKIKTITPKGHTWTYEYDENDNLIKEVSPSGDMWTYECDDHGNPIKKVSPSGRVRTWEYLYYDNGQLKEIVDYVKFPKIEEK